MNNFCIMLENQPKVVRPIPNQKRFSIEDVVSLKLFINMDGLINATFNSYEIFLADTGLREKYVAISLKMLANYSEVSEEYLEEKVKSPFVIKHGSMPYVLLVHPDLKQDVLVIPDNL